MRVPKYMSHSSFSLYKQNKQQFFEVYCVTHPPERMKQTRAMSVGSAFDAEIKNLLVKELWDDVPPQFELETLFNKQVEEHNREFARPAGKYLIQQYKELGALADLMLDLSKSIIIPRFEFELISEVEGVPLKGYPDVFFVTEKDARIIFDFKVNGYDSREGAAPKRGWVKVRGEATKQKNFPMLMDYKGVKINVSDHFEHIDSSWAQQNTMYAWMLGETIGSDFIIGIEQLACTPWYPMPKVKIASHRGKVSPKFQENLISEMQEAWDRITNLEICDNQEEIEAKCTAMWEMKQSEDPKERAFARLMG